MRKFSSQEVINIAVELYDEKGYSRADVRTFINALVAVGLSDLDAHGIDGICDLVF